MSRFCLRCDYPKETERERLKRHVGESAARLREAITSERPLPRRISEMVNDLVVRFDHLVRYLEVNPLDEEVVEEIPAANRPISTNAGRAVNRRPPPGDDD
jgi:hypothetical protein